MVQNSSMRLDTDTRNVPIYLPHTSCHGVITETLWGKQLLSLQIVLATDVSSASCLSVVPLDSS